MADLFLIEEFRAYLIAQGIVRAYGTAGTLPQCVLAPRDGAPEPYPLGKTYADAVVTLEQTGHVVRGPMEEFLEEAIVSVTTRAFRSQDAELIQRRIRNIVNGEELLTMGALLVEWARVWIGDQPLAADSVSHTRRQAFRFGIRVKALAGVPYTP